MHADLDVAVATVAAFAERTGSTRIVVLLDGGDDPPTIVEWTPEGVFEVTERETTSTAVLREGVRSAPLPPISVPPASSVFADPETGELSAPIGAITALTDGVLALAQALGGRAVATAEFPTRDPELPLTIAAREGDPIVLDIGGRQFALPGSSGEV